MTRPLTLPEATRFEPHANETVFGFTPPPLQIGVHRRVTSVDANGRWTVETVELRKPKCWRETPVATLNGEI